MATKPQSKEIMSAQEGSSLEIDQNPPSSFINASDTVSQEQAPIEVHYRCDDPATRQLVESILSLYPQKRQMSQQLADFLLKANAK